MTLLMFLAACGSFAPESTDDQAELMPAFGVTTSPDWALPGERIEVMTHYAAVRPTVVAVAAGPSIGQTCPPNFGGACFDIANARIFGPVAPGGFNVRRFTTPPMPAGGEMRFQLAARTANGPEVSAVTVVPILDPALDTDGDSLTNAEERAFGSSALLTDSDGGGADDATERRLRLDPNNRNDDVRAFPEADCTDGIDNDIDGRADCRDRDCFAEPACAEVCDDGIDNNFDLRIDCEDQYACAASPACVEVCDNGMDDDADGRTDCADSYCSGAAGCDIPEICDDGFDNDGNGARDRGDATCAAQGLFGEICDNGIDDNGNLYTDCADWFCAASPACVEICDNGIDDDGDRYTDCADPNCVGAAACVEDCATPGDENANRLADCADPACSTLPGCAEQHCADGLDDDADGRVDCADDDCWGTGCESAGVVTWVTGGLLTIDYSDHYLPGNSSETFSGVATGLTGKVRVVDASGVAAVCDWTVAQTSFESNKEYPYYPSPVTTPGVHTSPTGVTYLVVVDGDDQYTAVEATHQGVWVDPACGVSADTFLPRFLHGRSSPALGQPWMRWWNPTLGAAVDPVGAPWFGGFVNTQTVTAMGETYDNGPYISPTAWQQQVALQAAGAHGACVNGTPTLIHPYNPAAQGVCPP